MRGNLWSRLQRAFRERTHQRRPRGTSGPSGSEAERKRHETCAQPGPNRSATERFRFGRKGAAQATASRGRRETPRFRPSRQRRRRRLDASLCGRAKSARLLRIGLTPSKQAERTLPRRRTRIIEVPRCGVARPRLFGSRPRAGRFAPEAAAANHGATWRPVSAHRSGLPSKLARCSFSTDQPRRAVAATALATCVGLSACTGACARLEREPFLEARVGSGRRSAAPAGSTRALCETRSRYAARRVLLVVAAGRMIGTANRVGL